MKFLISVALGALILAEATAFLEDDFIGFARECELINVRLPTLGVKVCDLPEDADQNSPTIQLINFLKDDLSPTLQLLADSTTVPDIPNPVEGCDDVPIDILQEFVLKQLIGVLNPCKKLESFKYRAISAVIKQLDKILDILKKIKFVDKFAKKFRRALSPLFDRWNKADKKLKEQCKNLNSKVRKVAVEIILAYGRFKKGK
jgi:hypothetical protein